MNDTKWTVIQIPGGDLVSELAGDFLLETGADGFTSEGDQLNVFFREDSWNKSVEENIRAKIQSFVENGILQSGDLSVTTVKHEDWVGKWRRALGPIRAGEHFVIIPPGVEATLEEGDIPLNLEPRMAFGTGEHPTTKMALALLEKTVKAGVKIVDMGCGNGILAIGALSLGAEKILAIDNEPESVQETLENSESHGFSDKITVLLEDVLDYQIPGKFDILVANIFVNPILRGFPSWKSCLKDESSIIFTGVKEEEESPRLISRMAEMGFKLVEGKTLDSWFAGLFRATHA